MFKRLGLSSPMTLGFLNVVPKENHDSVSETSKYAQALYEANANQTGKDRLYMMFSIDEFGARSPEFNSIIQAGMLGMFSGVCIGGFLQSRTAYMDFMERNQATAFNDHIAAKKKMQDHVTKNFAKGAFSWGWRLGLFTSSYVAITTSIATYRGRSGIVEYVTAGAVTGAAYKCSLGLRGLVVGGILGSVLGGVAGAISLTILRLTGTTMEEVRFWQHSWKTSREDAKRKVLHEHKKASEDPLLVHHDKVVVNKIKLDSIPDEPQTPAESTKPVVKT